ncbi:UDP-glucosyltransferase 2-like [Amyelois transitella]|uniref:UDP-glucosyltransferase 2-like n=1 Tax=Amyelois transitella TaxID=680683 RepID=UPI00298F4760|nr:UDP-glucosyltransferase 2-like [Amyelois transitella]
MIRVVLVLIFIVRIETAKILAIFPTPSISHQVVFRPLIQELAKRGHQVTVITTDPVFPKEGTLNNFTEIDIHDVSYKIWRETFLQATITSGNTDDIINQMYVAFDLLTDLFEIQMNIDEVKSVVNDKAYDLLILEGIAKPALALSHIYKVPVIQFSSLVPVYNNLQTLGAPAHRLLNPELIRQKIHNLTMWDKIKELYTQFRFENIIDKLEIHQDSVIKRIFGADIPPLKELYNNIDMLFVNCHPLWDSNRAVPPSLVYLGGIHKNPHKDLPKVVFIDILTNKNNFW